MLNLRTQKININEHEGRSGNYWRSFSKISSLNRGGEEKKKQQIINQGLNSKLMMA